MQSSPPSSVPGEGIADRAIVGTGGERTRCPAHPVRGSRTLRRRRASAQVNAATLLTGKGSSAECLPVRAWRLMKDKAVQDVQRAHVSADIPYDRWIFWCEASSCRFSGAAESRAALVDALRTQGTTSVAVVRSGCLGLCGAGPSAVTYPEGTVYLHADREHAGRLAASLGRGARGEGACFVSRAAGDTIASCRGASRPPPSPG